MRRSWTEAAMVQFNTTVQLLDRQCKTKNNFPTAGLISNHGTRALFNIMFHADTITFIFHTVL